MPATFVDRMVCFSRRNYNHRKSSVAEKEIVVFGTKWNEYKLSCFSIRKFIQRNWLEPMEHTFLSFHSLTTRMPPCGRTIDLPKKTKSLTLVSLTADVSHSLPLDVSRSESVVDCRWKLVDNLNPMLVKSVHRNMNECINLHFPGTFYSEKKLK